MAKNEGWLAALEGSKVLSVQLSPDLHTKMAQTKEFIASLKDWNEIKSQWLKNADALRKDSSSLAPN